MQIEHLSGKAMLEALKNCTWIGKLCDRIMTKSPQIFFKAVAIAMKMIDLDEDKKMHKKDEERAPKRREHDTKRDKNPIVGFKREAEKFTLLNVPRSEILIWIQQNNIYIPQPRKINPNYKRNHDKSPQCKSLQDHGHDTDECRDL